MRITKKQSKRLDTYASGAGRWLKVRGQSFTDEEAKEATDFSDMIESYGFKKCHLADFASEKGLPLGHRLYLAENIHRNKLDVMLLIENDDRIVEIIKERMGIGTL